MWFLSLGWRDVADQLHQPTMIEPVYPLERCELNHLESSPRAAWVNGLALQLQSHFDMGPSSRSLMGPSPQRPCDDFGGLDLLLGQSVGAVNVMDETAAMNQVPDK